MKYDFENIKNNETPEMCKVCGGACCKRQPYTLFPHDIFGNEEPTVEKLVAFLSTDNYQIDWWEGDLDECKDLEIDKELGRIYYVRPREKKVSWSYNCNRLYDPMWLGECYLLGPNGCTLDWEHRPTGAKCLTCIAPNVPSKDSPNGKLEAVKRWRPLQWLFADIENRILK